MCREPERRVLDGLNESKPVECGALVQGRTNRSLYFRSLCLIIVFCCVVLFGVSNLHSPADFVKSLECYFMLPSVENSHSWRCFKAERLGDALWESGLVKTSVPALGALASGPPWDGWH